MSTDTETTPDLTEYENWTAEDCYHADRQIELLAGEKRDNTRKN
jgi:hypothetical protein